MGLEKPVNGAFQAVESVNKPVSGAFQECEAVCKPLNGAWQEIWNAIKYLVKKSNTIANGWATLRDNGLTFYYNKYEDEGGQDGDISGTGALVLYLDGEWEDPSVTFDWEGGFYRSSANLETWYTNNAGSISIYYRKADGTEGTATAVSRMGQSASGADIDTENETGTYSGTLQGSYNRLGISIEPTGYSSAAGYWSANLDIIVKNLKFNNCKIAFPESAKFDYT